eukprot:TRINITY_DN5586_c0_g1_i1.p1 TRINITY_DN5586_c0_g1~~TRINITY_DN5586_c0_g1_i1.p1  ORF type:complete len:417 (+),score=62.33 TRINITY_DN5586_c0_g1_i1:47-1252(+)
MVAVEEVEGTTDVVREQFRRLDRNRDGTLSFREIKELLKRLNSGFSEHQLQKLFCEIDSNQDGKIQIDEFIEFMGSGKASQPAVRAEPPQGTVSSHDVRQEWKQATLDAHNTFRAVHNVDPLTWSDECYIEAKKQADECQRKRQLGHGHTSGPSGNHGQNAYWCSAPGSSAFDCTKSWYDEIDDPGYDFEAPGFTSGTGHFTQVVWKGTRQVGMAASEDGRFVVANYLPPGNFLRAFKENVPRRTGPSPTTPTVSTNSLRPQGKAEPQRPSPKPSPRPVPSQPKAEPKRQSQPKAEPKRQSEPKAEPKRPIPSRTRQSRNAALAETVEESSVEATEMTEELLAAFQDCPFPFADRVKAAFAAKECTKVSVTRKDEGQRTTMTVLMQQGGGFSQMRGSWGGG